MKLDNQLEMTAAADPARERNRDIWQACDWDKVASYIGETGPRLRDDIGAVGPGVQLLDVAHRQRSQGRDPGRTARRTCHRLRPRRTVADRGARARRRGGRRVEWVVGDADDLPFPDDSFDIVTSTFGHMFAFDHPGAACELVRVCRPGGTIGLCCWTPGGPSAQFFAAIAERMPSPPADFPPPVLWALNRTSARCSGHSV